LDIFFKIASQIVKGLAEVHQMGIIHGSLTPSNILINPETLQVKISDFGCSSQLNKEFQTLVYFQAFSISLAYVSPEQTGRANRDVDQRTDFYSLGMIFYALLCGSVPFSSNDPSFTSMLDIIYAHLAVNPVPLYKHNPEKIPVQLSDIVMKLIEKNADSRYQSTFGIENDLYKCKEQWEITHCIERFPIALKDVCSSFHIHQCIYGREKEIQQLLNAFDRVANAQEPNILLLVRGYSGIGKTTLINELHKPLTRQRGYFISGKFDQFKRNIPFFAFIQAFQQLVLQLLTEPEEKIIYWRQQLLSALGNKGQIIIDVIPQVEMIIGPQPSVPVLKPAENQNRFNAVLQSFIRVFANKQHPLVIVLDDLQWSDLATLNLMELLMSDNDNSYLLIIGAYRSNEVHDVHPLTKLLSSLSAKRTIEEIALGPLPIESVNDLVSDTLFCDKDKSSSLSKLVFNKTQGNPFFVIMFLTNLAKDNLIYFSFKTGSWEWSMPAIDSRDITSNVVDMMTERIQKLPTETQELLSLAASIGNQFTLHLLALVYEHSAHHTYSVLWYSIKDELLIHLSSEYKWLPDDESLVHINPQEARFKFLHDRVQQAAYELVNVSKRIETHLKIGRLLRTSLPESEQEERLFDIIGHFRLAKDLLTDDKENRELILMILSAAKRAKDSAAYDTACGFLIFGAELLPTDSWECDYELTFQLLKLLSECEYLRRNYTRAEELYTLLISHAKTDLEKISVLCLQANQFETQQKWKDAILIMLHGLKILGIEFPSDDESRQIYFREQLALIPTNLGDRKIMDLVNSPEITDPRHAAAINLLMSTWTPCYATGQQSLLVCLTMKMANLSLMHGNCDVTSATYVFYSFLVGDITGDYQTAHEFGKVGMELSNRYENLQARSKCYFIFYCGTNIWVHHLKDCIGYLERCFEISLEAGDIAISGHSAHYIVSDAFYAGYDLPKALDYHDRYNAYLKRTNYWLYAFGAFSTTLERWFVGDESFDEEAEAIVFASDPVLTACYHFGKLMKYFWLRSSNLLELADNAYDVCAVLLFGTFKVVELYLYCSLIYISHLKDFNDDDREKYLKRIDVMMTKLSTWATNNEANVKHKLLLVQAELTRYKGDILQATDYYEQAIDSAGTFGFIQYEGLANELCAEMLLMSGKTRYARCHLLDALYIYRRYGAKVKVEQLKHRYPAISYASRNESIDDTDDSGPSQIDLLTLMKSMKTISSSMKLDEFIDSYMKIIIQNAGAQRAVCLLLESDGNFLVLAEGDIDNVQTDSLRAVPFDNNYLGCPRSMIHLATRTKQMILLEDCSKDNAFAMDPYLLNNAQVKSILVLPIIKKSEFKAVLYLESTLTNAFNERQAEILSIMTAQMMILLENEKFSILLESEKKYRSLVTELELVKKRLEEFIDVLCHELRNPLAGLYASKDAMADLLRKLRKSLQESDYTIERHEDAKKEAIQEKLRDFSELIHAFSITSEHLKDIVDTVLTVSMLENQNVKLQAIPFSPSDVIQNVSVMFKAKLTEKHLDLVVDIPQKSQIQVIGDPYRLKEVLINLLSNAIKFTEHGNITIHYSATVHATTTDLNFEVSDTGIGLDDNERARLFQPFSQANSQTYAKYGGSGLGLKISKQIIELMGGTISLESEKGKGSRFIFSITLDNVQPVVLLTLEENNNSIVTSLKPASSQEGKTNDKKNQLRVLVAEDNVINRKLLKRLIERSGHHCEVAENGLECLNMYSSFCQSEYAMDVILMDIEMPIMGGLESAREIRNLEKERGIEQPVIIIAVSANARNDFMKVVISNGMQDFVTKPYLSEDIIRTIKKWTHR
jgi:predicted ATPase/signal transduction histidine kinase/CheY-like chemotaxis protein